MPSPTTSRRNRPLLRLRVTSSTNVCSSIVSFCFCTRSNSALVPSGRFVARRTAWFNSSYDQRLISFRIIEDLGDGDAPGFRVAPKLALDDRQQPLLAHVGDVDGTGRGGQLATERYGGSERGIDLCDGQDFRRLEQKLLQPILVIPANPGPRLQSAAAQRNRTAALQLRKVDRLAVPAGRVSPIHRLFSRRGCNRSRSGPE